MRCQRKSTLHWKLVNQTVFFLKIILQRWSFLWPASLAYFSRLTEFRSVGDVPTRFYTTAATSENSQFSPRLLWCKCVLQKFCILRVFRKMLVMMKWWCIIIMEDCKNSLCRDSLSLEYFLDGPLNVFKWKSKQCCNLENLLTFKCKVVWIKTAHLDLQIPLMVC